MAYATIEDYQKYGVTAIPEEEVTNLLKIANMDIELLLGGRFIFEKLDPIHQELIIKAVIAQAEYLNIHGEDISIGGAEYDSVSIGAYSESKGYRANSSSGQSMRYSPNALAYLSMAGILYRPVRLL